MALTICEDAWNDKHFWDRRMYGVDPVEDLIAAGGKVLLNISASPYYLHKRELRRKMLAAIATNHRVPVAMVNQIGGNDSLVFDGSSMALGPDGTVIAQAKSFEEDLFHSTPNLSAVRFMAPTNQKWRVPTPRWYWARATMCTNAASDVRFLA